MTGFNSDIPIIITVPAGTTRYRVYLSDLPGTGVISRFRLRQRTGTLAGFTYDVFNSRAAVADGTPTAEVDGAVAADAHSLRVFGFSAANTAREPDPTKFPLDGMHNLHLPYTSRDSKPHSLSDAGYNQVDRSNMQKGLYLLLTFGSATGDIRIFDLSVDVLQVV